MSRKCKVCSKPLPKHKDCTDLIQKQRFCGISCLSDHGRAKAQEAKDKRLAQMIRPTKAPSKRRKKDLSTDHGHQVQITQDVFNRMIRLLDDGKPCISCGRYKCGAYWDAGHYRSVGGNPEMRFDPRGCHRQGSACNRANRRPEKNNPRSAETISQEYQQRLRERYGDELVDWLNGPHPAANYTIPDLKDMRRIMAAECRQLERGEGPSRDWRAVGFSWDTILNTK